MTVKNNSPIVWYIPGFYSADDPQEKALQLLQTIYSSAEEITNITWENQNGSSIKLDSVVSKGVKVAFSNSNLLRGLMKFAIEAVGSITDRWEKALNDAKLTAELLANKIINDLSSSQRQNLILIGHSLGGNIVIRTLAHLHRQKLSINSAVLLGAAIDNADNDIPAALNATRKPVYSMVNPNDTALKVFQTVTGCPALGTGIRKKYNDSKFIEYYTTSYYGHSSAFYLSQWAEFNNIKIDSFSFSAQLLENTAYYLGINKSDE